MNTRLSFRVIEYVGSVPVNNRTKSTKNETGFIYSQQPGLFSSYTKLIKPLPLVNGLEMHLRKHQSKARLFVTFVLGLAHILRPCAKCLSNYIN